MTAEAFAFFFCLLQSFSISALCMFGARESYIVEAVLCIEGHLAASLASTYLIPATFLYL